jgi:hypothetical protein
MTPEVRQFHSIAQEFLNQTHRLFPHHASALGLHQFDSELGLNEPEVHLQYCDLLARTLTRVERLPETAFAGDGWLDRRGFLAMLRTDILDHAVLRRWRNNPQLHSSKAIDSIFSLLVRNSANPKRILPVVESRLSKIPAFLAAGAACVQKPVPLWTKLSVQSCKGACAFIDGIDKQLAPLARRQAHFSRLCTSARAAFADYAQAIAKARPGSSSGYCIGRANFEFLIRERLGLEYSLAEAEAVGHHLIAKLSAELKREAAKFDKRNARQIIMQAASRWKPASENLLAEYQRVTAEMRRRFAAKNLLTLPRGETLRVMPAPDFLRHLFPTAAYDAPLPYEKKQVGFFWVNDLSQRHRDPAKRRAEIEQHFGLELTCAHEAYPGHHVQFVMQCRHPSKLRRLFSHSIFYEGWTLWCEKMCIDHRIYTARHARVSQLADALWRAHRILIDCGLHSGRLTHASACKELVNGVGFTPSRAEADVNWYTSAPTVPMSYLLGRLELEKVHDRLVGGDGWTLRKFNDWILSFGSIPWSWIWQSRLRSQPR